MWVQVVRTVVQSLVSMGMALLSEAFLKDVILMGLEKLASKTNTDWDDKLVQDVRKAWSK